MSLFINTNLEIVFISIPKCASEYMEIILSKYGFKNHSNDAIVQHKSNGLNNYIKYVSDNGLSDFYDSFLTNYKFFTIVRNPYERFLSGFLYCCGKPFYIKEKELLPEFQEGLRSTHMSLDNNKMINFVSLDEAIQNKNNLYNLNIYAYGHLFITQSHLLQDLPGTKTIIKFENINDELSNYFQQLNLSYTPEVVTNKTTRFYKIFDYFSDYSINFINTYFENDFINFGYTKFNNLNDMITYYESIN